MFSRRTDPNASFDLWIMEGDGTGQRQLTNHPGDELQAAASPDGRFVAYVRALKGEYVAANPTGTIQILDLEEGTERPLVTSPRKDYKPSWSADGTRIAFSRETGSAIDIFGVDVSDIGPSGSDAASPISAQPDPENYPSWSPSGRSLVFVSQAASLAIVDTDGTRRPLTVGQSPQWRPGDESTIAFQLVDVDGDLDIYTVAPGATPVPVRLFDTDDAHERFVAWSSDGSRLGYARVPREGECALAQLARCPSQIYAVSYTTAGAGTPVAIGAVDGAFDNYPTFVRRRDVPTARPAEGSPGADGRGADEGSRGSLGRDGSPDAPASELPVTGHDQSTAIFVLGAAAVVASAAARRRSGTRTAATR